MDADLSAALVLRLGSQHVPRATEVLCEAFHDYPVMRYVLGATSPDFDERLRTLIGFFVLARVFRAEPVFGVLSGSDILGVALVSYPADAPIPADLSLLRDDVWANLGSGARARYETLTAVWQAMALSVPHVHLNMIGVPPDLRGRGVSRLLLNQVHEASRDRPASQGVTLTTEDRSNLSLYSRFGYEIIGHAEVASEMETWALFRPNGVH